VSSWPDVPAIFESLNDDTLTTVLEFVGDKSYRSFGGVNKHCKEIYLLSGMTKETFLFGYAPLSRIINEIEANWDWELIVVVGKGVVLYNRSDVLEWALEERHYGVLRGICNVAAGEGRIDILEEVWGNVIEEDRYVFEAVDSCAAEGGKLDVLKWLETKGLELDRGLYLNAISGDHLQVMKWLREKELDWNDYTFVDAAEEGNLEVLQWLHYERCPWNNYCVYERDLKPEAVEWLRSNGYSDRLI